MERPKIAALKLITGEEIVCTLLELIFESGYKVLVIRDPLKIQIRDKRKIESYSLSKWLVIGNEGIHDIEISRIITVNQIDNDELLNEYKSFFRKKLNSPKSRASKKVGFIGNTKEYKKIFERLYNDVDAYERPKDL